MFIDANSVIINGIPMGQYLVECEFQYNKLWASDSGRNLAGVMSGTLIGVFPKLICKFGPLTQAQIETLAPVFDSATQTTRYYDPKKRQTVSMTTYTGDWSMNQNNLGKAQGFSVSFIAVRKRA